MAELVPVLGAAIPVAIKLFEVGEKLWKFSEDKKADKEIKKKEVKNLHSELLWMRAFLLDTQNKCDSRHKNLFQILVSEVSKLADECDDIAKNLSLIASEKQKTSLRIGIPHKTDTSIPTSLSKRITAVLSDISDLSKRQNFYYPNAHAGNYSSGTNIIDKDSMEKMRTTHYTNEPIVGRQNDITDLTTILLNGDSKQFVIPIVGMRGLGKTALARELYNSTSSQDHFKTRGWAYVSLEYDTKDILMSLIHSMTNPIHEDWIKLTSIESMEDYLGTKLSDRRFLVVIDDVRERDVWDRLKRAFPDSNNGSKVIITTTNDDVARLQNNYVHTLEPLNEKESWDLFRKKALPRDAECPPHLTEIGKQIVAKCLGLPFSIVVLGEKLFGKEQIHSVWKDVSDNHQKIVRENVNAVFTASFVNLPEHLKQCFLYVAMFPKNLEIPISRLMLLWEAEDFIKKGDEEGYIGKETKSYFEELVDRNLFSKKCGDWIDSTFQVHDLLRDLAVHKARETILYIYYYGNETCNILKAPEHKRLAVFHPHNEIPIEYSNPQLHTLRGGVITANALGPSSSSPSRKPFQELFQTLHPKFRDLRVLDVQIHTINNSIHKTIGKLTHLRFLGIQFEHKLDECKIPKTIGKLTHLRFLGIQFEHKLDECKIPNTIGNLSSLQTLSVVCLSGGKVTLPKTVSKLTQLKHLIGYFIFSGNMIGNFVHLETLEGISSEKWCCLDTTKLGNIRHLKLWIIQKVGNRFYDNFSKVTKLQTLTLDCELKSDSDISLEMIFQLCPSISHLKTRGISFHNSLNLDKCAENLEVLELVLNGAQTEINNSISSIGKLPQLAALHVDLIGREPICFNEGFAQLIFLKIKSKSHSNVEEGCMPLLKYLEVSDPTTFQGPEKLMKLIK